MNHKSSLVAISSHYLKRKSSLHATFTATLCVAQQLLWSRGNNSRRRRAFSFPQNAAVVKYLSRRVK
jgi:hypothetical protein